MILKFNKHFYAVPANCSVIADESTIIIKGAFAIPFERNDLETKTVVLILDRPRSAKWVGEQVAYAVEHELAAVSVEKTDVWETDNPFGYIIDFFF